MVNVQIGDTVQAKGLGLLFIKSTGGSGTGVVKHVGNEDGTISDPEVQAEFDAGLFDVDYLIEGIMYHDTLKNELMWLATDDFTVIAQGGTL